MKIKNSSLEVVRGSVVSQEVPVIVNAANMGMRGGGGVDGAIHMAAGPNLLQELRQAAPRGAVTAEVVVTSACLLPQHYIFHVAGPIYRNYSPEEAARLLRACYRNCLEEAVRLGALGGIAFPSISTGAYGFPIESAAPIALRTASKYLETAQSGLLRVVFAMFGREELEVFERHLQVLEAEADNI